MAGLVPAIHAVAQRVVPRVKPGDDGGEMRAQEDALPVDANEAKQSSVRLGMRLASTARLSPGAWNAASLRSSQ
ncbi:hypothetical protein GCM10007036_02270 [Alsobacter metallidurans]|uniref:Uncharacterized protein n=1 Tax=Alsobacter metallidurans TaxID=340221 RepID=A0A917I3T7_9HYPH|nr:hypothetical protein GCM10007036_02270 [Alsobacter metallidurans]